ncbi:MAG: hypothetical protein UZ22_OP11002000754 [Microgenomates bacterium OLB23]|nr:MAG: hypothetical protein UZ22_OP11002000754 [Microgenomates bacterium OLB23]
MAKKAIKKKLATHTKKAVTANWLVPAIITVLIGCAVMYWWAQRDIEAVKQQEDTLYVPLNKPQDGGATVKGASTSERNRLYV